MGFNITNESKNVSNKVTVLNGSWVGNHISRGLDESRNKARLCDGDPAVTRLQPNQGVGTVERCN